MLKPKANLHSTKEKLQKQIAALLKRWQDAHAKFQGNEPAILLSREIREMRLMLCHCLLEMIHAEPLHYGTSSLNLLWEQLFYPHFVMTKRLKKIKKHDNLSSILIEYRNVLGLAATVLRRAMAIIYCNHSNQELLSPILSPFMDIITACPSYKGETAVSSEVSSRLEYQEWSLDSLFLCLMHLGDVYRYHLDLKEDHYKLFAQRCYNLANMLKPSEGLTFNAIGNLDTSTYYGLPAVYNYLQALTVTNAFPSAKMNLEVVLNRCSHLLRILLSCKRKSERNANSRTKQVLAVKHFIHRFLAVIHRSILPHSAHAKMDVRDVCRDVSRRFVLLLQSARLLDGLEEESGECAKSSAKVSLATDRGSPHRLTTIIIHLVILTTCMAWDYTFNHPTISPSQNEEEDSQGESAATAVDKDNQVHATRACLADLCLAMGIAIMEHTLAAFHGLCLKEKARTKQASAASNVMTSGTKKESVQEAASPTDAATDLTNQIQMMRRKKLTAFEEDASDLSEGNENFSDARTDSDEDPKWQQDSTTVVTHDSEEDDQKMRSHYGIPMEEMEDLEDEEGEASDSGSTVSTDGNQLEEDEGHLILISNSLKDSANVLKSSKELSQISVPPPIRLPRAGTALKVISEELSPSNEEQTCDDKSTSRISKDNPDLDKERSSDEFAIHVAVDTKMKASDPPSTGHIDWATLTTSDSDTGVMKDEQDTSVVESQKEKVVRRRPHKKCRLSISELSTVDLLQRAKMLHSLEPYLACVKLICNWYEDAFSRKQTPTTCAMLPLFWMSLKDLLNVTSPILALPDRLPASEVARVVKTKLPLSSPNSSWKQQIPLTEDRLLYGTHFLQEAHEGLNFQQRAVGPLEETVLRVECIFRFAQRHVILSKASRGSCFLKYCSSKEETTCCLFSAPLNLTRCVQWEKCLLPETCLPRSVRRCHPYGAGASSSAVPHLGAGEERKRGDNDGSRHQESEKLEIMKRMAALRLQSEVSRLEGHRRQQHHGKPGFPSKRDPDYHRSTSHRKTAAKQSHFHGRGSRNVALSENENWSRSTRSLDTRIRRRRQRASAFVKHSGDSTHEEDMEEGGERYNSSDNEFSPEDVDHSVNLKELVSHPLLGTVYLLPDTYCLMEHLHCVKSLLQTGHFLLIIPHVVVNHLDFLKKDNPQARNVIRFLEFQTKRGNRFIRFQLRHEQVEGKVIQQYVERHQSATPSTSHSHHQHSKHVPSNPSQSNYHWRWHQLIACAAHFQNQQRKPASDGGGGGTASRSVSILTDRAILGGSDGTCEPSTANISESANHSGGASKMGHLTGSKDVAVDMTMSMEILEMAEYFNVNIQHVEVFTKSSLQLLSSK